jgi:hypothetical protein
VDLDGSGGGGVLMLLAAPAGIRNQVCAMANAAGAVAASPSQAHTSPARAAAKRRMRRMGFMTVSFGS